MKALRKTWLGLALMLCLATGCDLLNYDEIDKDRTEQAPKTGGSDEDPCRNNCE